MLAHYDADFEPDPNIFEVSGRLGVAVSELQRYFEMLSCASQFGSISGNRELAFSFLCHLKGGKGNFMYYLFFFFFKDSFTGRSLCLSPCEKMDWVWDKGWQWRKKGSLLSGSGCAPHH